MAEDIVLQQVIDSLPANTISHHFISSPKHYLASERSAEELACGTRARKLSSRPASKHCKSYHTPHTIEKHASMHITQPQTAKSKLVAQ